MAEEYSEDVLKAYHTGTMSPEEAVKFKESVNSGEMTVPSWFDINETTTPEPVEELEVASNEFTPPQTATSGGEGAWLRDPNIMDMQEGEQAIAPEAHETLLKAYHTGEMSTENKQRFEQDVITGKTSIPDWFELDLQQPQATGGLDMESIQQGELPNYDDLKTSIRKIFSGEDKITSETEQMGDWQQLPEFNQMLSSEGVVDTPRHFFSQLGMAGATMAADNDSIANMFSKTYGVGVRQDKKGTWIMRSNIDGKDYAIKQGLRPNDIVRGVGTALMEAGGTKLFNWAKRLAQGTKVGGYVAPKIAKIGDKASKAIGKGTVGASALEEGTLELGHKLAQQEYGNELDASEMIDIAGASTIGALSRSVGKTIEGKKSMNANADAIKKAYPKQGSADFTDLKNLHAKDPDSLNESLAEYGFRKYDPDKGLVIEPDLEIALKDMAEGGGDMQQLRNAIMVDADSLKAFKEGDLPFTSRDLLDEDDFHSVKLFDSYRKEVGGDVENIVDQEAKNLIETGNKIEKDLQTLRKSSNAEELSDTIQDLSNIRYERLDKLSDHYYEKLGEYFPENFTHEPKNLLGFYQNKIDSLTPVELKKGYKYSDGTKSYDPIDVALTKEQADVYRRWSKSKSEYDPSSTGTVIGTQDKALKKPGETVVATKTETPSSDLVDAVTGKRTKTTDIGVGDSKRITGTRGGIDEVTGEKKIGYDIEQGTDKLQKKGSARPLEDLGAGKEYQKVETDPTYNMIDADRKRIGQSVGRVQNATDKNQYDIEYALALKDQKEAIESLNLGDEALDIYEKASKHHKAKKTLEKDMTRTYGKAFYDETQSKDFVKKMGSALSDLGGGPSKASSSKFINMVNSIPVNERKRFVSDSMLYALDQTGEGFNLEKFGKFWGNVKKNKKMMAFLSQEKNMDKDALDFFKTVGEASKALNMKKKEGFNSNYMKEIILGKENQIKNILGASAMAVAAGVGTSVIGLGLGAVGLGAVGGYMISMRILEALRHASVGNADKIFKKSVDIVNSKEMRKYLASAGKTKDMRELSGSKKMMEWAKQAKIAKNRTELEKWLTKSLRISESTKDSRYEDGSKKPK
jgi:hypothetical protein